MDAGAAAEAQCARPAKCGFFPARPRFIKGSNGAMTLGVAQRNYERYLARAREASLKGDTVEMQNFCQHAEHYLRVMRANAPKEH